HSFSFLRHAIHLDGFIEYAAPQVGSPKNGAVREGQRPYWVSFFIASRGAGCRGATDDHQAVFAAPTGALAPRSNRHSPTLPDARIVQYQYSERLEDRPETMAQHEGQVSQPRPGPK